MLLGCMIFLVSLYPSVQIEDAAKQANAHDFITTFEVQIRQKLCNFRSSGMQSYFQFNKYNKENLLKCISWTDT